ACGIWPMDPSPVLKRLQPTTPPDQTDQIDLEAPSRLSPADWARIERLLQETVKETTKGVASTLISSVHQLSTQNKLQAIELEGLRASLATKNKRKGHGKPLPLPVKNRTTGGAIFYSPRSVRVAKQNLAIKEAEEHQNELEKIDKKEVRRQNKLVKEKEAKERAEKRVKDKKRRDKEKAAKAAKTAAKKAESDRKKALQLSQKGKRKATKAPASRPIKKKRL
ncbi:hypothetical protein IQ06DRAFT_187214, partial [Phaeosphaeriaceae sp. SRC1lsM3a]